MIYKIVAEIILVATIWTGPKIVSLTPAPTGGVVLYVQYCSAALPKTLKVQIYRHGTPGHHVNTVFTRSVTLSHNKAPRVTMMLPEGGYQIGIYDGKCVADFSLGVLSDRLRTAAIKLRHYDLHRRADDEDMYGPAGDLAGTLPDGSSVILLAKDGRAYSPIVSKSAYYFDDIPAGKYSIRLSGANFSVQRTVVIPGDSLLLRNDL